MISIGGFMRRYMSLAVLLVLWPLYSPGWENARAVVLEIDGVIGPASSDYVQRNLRKAAEEGAALVIIRINTPGGLDSAMREIIQAIISSPVPVASYVAPSGARAASAGTYILYASHIAAMAPATNLGAATPVRIATPLASGGGEKSKKSSASPDEEDGDAMAHKIINDAVAYIQGLAKMRGRNAEWAEKAVREAASLPAEEALKMGVIDTVAKDIPDLLSQIDGKAMLVAGREKVLHTRGLTVEEMAPDWRSKLLAIISDPNVAYVLMLVGIYGIIYEIANPGMVLPGVAGAISLLLAMFAFQVMPVNYAGVGLIILGIAFMVGEALMPSFGSLGIGGLIAFVIGSVILIDTDVPGYGISPGLIAALSLASAAFLIFVVGMALKARRRPVVSGREELIGGTGVALENFDGDGHIRIHSEIWNARSGVPLRKGQQVRVIAMEGLILKVEPVTRNALGG
jgi:membrane-bound serine protease (ClpP class)